MKTLDVRPGDVLVVHDPGFWAWTIRLGPLIHNLLYGTMQPTKWNHVLVVMPDDVGGNRWAIEGRPGGVGWRDLKASGYLDSPYTLCNANQPKTQQQRLDVCAVMEAMATRHVPYNWPVIAAEVARVVSPLWLMPDKWGEGVPGHVICSSAADLAYERVGLESPHPDQFCAPWDWATYIIDNGWKR